MGLITTAIGCGMLYLFTVGPLLDAMRHASKIGSLSAKCTVVGFTLMWIGLSLVIWGDRARRFLNPQQGASKAPIYILSIVFIGAAIGLYFGVKSHIESLGYAFAY